LIKKHQKIYAWSCDYTKLSGEGSLARIFVKDLKKNKNKVIVHSHLPSNKELNFLDKYFSVIKGICFCWKWYLKGFKTSYINYTPLWNFLIFMLLPPKTILGPITGGANFNKDNYLNFTIRSIFFPIFFKISEYFLNLRHQKILFATSLLKKKLNKHTIKIGYFDYVFSKIKIKKFKKKTNDFLIYYKKNKNKLSFFPNKTLENIFQAGYNIGVVGDKLQSPYVKNYGYVNQEKLNKILSKTKFTIASGENIYSFFSLDCINNHTTIFIDKRYIKEKTEFDCFFKVIKLKNILFEIKKHTITKNVPSKKNIKKLRSFFVING
jgi:hypothetical protein